MIISASRRTDIPAFYGRWFFNRISDGHVCVRNPMGPRQVSRVNLLPVNIDCIVFWSKNPAPFMGYLNRLKNYQFYFLFSLTPYDYSIEPGLPLKNELLITFRQLFDQVGSHRVVWRYDPILFSEEIGVDYHVRNFRQMAEILHSYTERCIISFLDIYKKCERNLKNTTIRRPNDLEIEALLREMKTISDQFGLVLETCAEKKDWTSLGINASRCIDNRLIERITGKPAAGEKDKHQRPACGCIDSIDIGEYNTCRHFCRYCYANTNVADVKKKCREHDPKASVLTGHLDESDQVRERSNRRKN